MFKDILSPISDLLSWAVDFVWGWPLATLLIGGGVYLLLISKLLPLRGFKHAIGLILGKTQAGGSKAEGQISHLQGLTNALASTVGLGNIAGVAVAIAQGGAGAVFWMWVAGIIGMNTKFFECTLALMYRGKDYQGEVQGGPMYLIQSAMGKKWQVLAYMFALCGLVGATSMFQTNQLAVYIEEQYSVAPYWIGLFCALLVGYILFGGIQRLSKVTERLVPPMCLVYILMCLAVIFIHIDKVPAMFLSIFTEAFTGTAAAGGAMGVGVLKIMQIGIKRGAYSNEAGMGTAPMAHGNVKTSEPISEGLVAMLGPFIDTVIVCTMTALVILVNKDTLIDPESSGILLAIHAFKTSLPGLGVHLLGFAILLFSLTTMIGMANYNQKCWNFLFKGRWGMSAKVGVIYFCTTLFIGAVGSLDDILNLVDLGGGLMIFPNMIVVLILAPKAKKALNQYLAKI